MASSGSKTENTYPGQSCTTTLSWSQTGSNIANNTRTVSLTCKIELSPAGSRVNGTVQFNCSASGITFSPASVSTGDIIAGSSKSFTSTVTIKSSDVTGSASGFSRTVYLIFNGTVNGRSVTNKSSGTLTINPDGITRRSAPTVPSSITLGTNFTITTNRPSSTFTHTIQLKIGSGSFSNLATGVGASITNCNASIATWAPSITTAASASGTIRTITYESGSQVGYVDNTVVVNVPASCVPTISTPTISDTNGYLSRFGYLLSGASKLHLSWQETTSYSSAISSRAVKIFGVSVAISGASSSGCDATITNIGTNQGTAAVTITDGRGRTATGTTQSFKIVAYNKPVVGNSVVYRSDANGEADLNGGHIAIRVPWTKSILYDANNNEINFITLQVKIDNTLVTTYGSSSADAPNNQILVIPGTYSDAANYQVELTVVDTVGQSSKYTTTIATVSRPMSVRAYIDPQTGTKKWGMAIGKISEIPEALEIDVPNIWLSNPAVWRNALELTNTSLSSSIITPGTGITILTATGKANKCMISMRVSCKKTDGSVFSGRTDPLFTIAEGYRPPYAFTTTAITNSTVNSYMTGYCGAYITTAGKVIIDVITASQKEIDVHFCYLL